MAEHAMEVADRVSVELAGEHDAVLRALEERLGIDIDLRGTQVLLKGDEVRVERGAAVIEELARLVDSGRTLAPTMIEAVASAIEQAGRPDALLGDVVWRHRQRSLTPTTAGQKAYVDAIRKNTITFGIGATIAPPPLLDSALCDVPFALCTVRCALCAVQALRGARW